MGGFCASEGLNREELLQALANVGAELAHQVPGRVSTEIDARLAYDTQGIIQRVWAFSFFCLCCLNGSQCISTINNNIWTLC